MGVNDTHELCSIVAMATETSLAQIGLAREPTETIRFVSPAGARDR